MRLLLPLLIAGLLAGCGGGGGDEAATSTPAAKQSAADAEGEIRETFEAYNKALAGRDYDGACDQLSPETVTKLRANLVKAGLKDAPEDCPGLLKAIYTATDQDPTQKKTLDEVATSAKIDKVTITGDTAVIDWNATVQGKNTKVTQAARRIDGEWKLVDVTN
jgi:hypothetical protein